MFYLYIILYYNKTKHIYINRYSIPFSLILIVSYYTDYHQRAKSTRVDDVIEYMRRFKICMHTNSVLRACIVHTNMSFYVLFQFLKALYIFFFIKIVKIYLIILFFFLNYIIPGVSDKRHAQSNHIDSHIYKIQAHVFLFLFSYLCTDKSFIHFLDFF